MSNPPLTAEDKLAIKQLEEFVNDIAFMELYGYTSFKPREIVGLYQILKASNKVGLHRAAMAQEALIHFPHRKKGESKTKKLVGTVAVAIVVLLLLGLGASKVFAW